MKDSVPQDYNMYRLEGREKIRCVAFAAIVIFLTAYLFYHSLFLSFCLPVVSFAAVKPYERHLAKKRKCQLSYQFRDALYAISASVAAGRQLPEALSESAESMKLLYGEKALITCELAHVSSRILELKETEETVLLDWARRTAIPDIVNFVDVYNTCRESGGDIEKVLAKTSRLIMERIGTEQDIQVVVAQKKLETKILLIMPLATLLFMQFASQDYIAVLYETAAGRVVMTLAAAAMTGAWILSRKITDIAV